MPALVTAPAHRPFTLVADNLPTPAEIETAVNSRQFGEAEGMLREVIKAKPESAKAHYSLAQVLHMRGKPAEAYAEIMTAKQLDPSLGFAGSKARFDANFQAIKAAAMAETPLPEAKKQPAPPVPMTTSTIQDSSTAAQTKSDLNVPSLVLGIVFIGVAVYFFLRAVRNGKEARKAAEAAEAKQLLLQTQNSELHAIGKALTAISERLNDGTMVKKELVSRTLANATAEYTLLFDRVLAGTPVEPIGAITKLATKVDDLRILADLDQKDVDAKPALTTEPPLKFNLPLRRAPKVTQKSRAMKPGPIAPDENRAASRTERIIERDGGGDFATGILVGQAISSNHAAENEARRLREENDRLRRERDEEERREEEANRRRDEEERRSSSFDRESSSSWDNDKSSSTERYDRGSGSSSSWDSGSSSSSGYDSGSSSSSSSDW